jgi:predicted nucleic acid-binding Zn finger protein
LRLQLTPSTVGFKQVPFPAIVKSLEEPFKTMAVEELLVLERILDEIRSERSLSHTNWERLRSIFAERFDKAWRLVEEKRVKRYTFHPSKRIVWVVVGRGGEYQLYSMAGYCGCDDFYFRVINGEVGICYHLLSQKLAEVLVSYESVDEEDDAYKLLISEWREQMRSDDD